MTDMAKTLSLPRIKRAALAGLMLAALAGCETPAPYAPRLPGQSTGYTDRALTANRYRVTFSGNSVTPRETVENYLLLRAAEVTLAAGYSAFMFDARDTRTDTHYYADPLPPAPYYGYWHFRPAWGYDGFGPDVEVTQVTRFQAFAEIVLLKSDDASKQPRAIDARQIIAHLSPPPPAPAAQSGT